jgi:hypothetical protein
MQNTRMQKHFSHITLLINIHERLWYTPYMLQEVYAE